MSLDLLLSSVPHGEAQNSWFAHWSRSHFRYHLVPKIYSFLVYILMYLHVHVFVYMYACFLVYLTAGTHTYWHKSRGQKALDVSPYLPDTLRQGLYVVFLLTPGYLDLLSPCSNARTMDSVLSMQFFLHFMTSGYLDSGPPTCVLNVSTH